jgi:hypothetical protein
MLGLTNTTFAPLEADASNDSFIHLETVCFEVASGLKGDIVKLHVDDIFDCGVG